MTEEEEAKKDLEDSYKDFIIQEYLFGGRKDLEEIVKEIWRERDEEEGYEPCKF